MKQVKKYLFIVLRGLKITSFIKIILNKSDRKIIFLNGQADEHLKKGEFAAAEKVFNTIVKKHSGSPHGYAGLARVAFLTKKWDEAIMRWKKVIVLFPEYETARVQLGLTYTNAGKPQKAEKVLVQAISSNPKSVQALKAAAQLFTTIRRFNKALPYWEKACKFAPDNDDAQKGYIDCLVHLLRFDKAIQHYNCIKNKTNSTRVLASISDIYQAQYKLDEALEVLQGLKSKYHHDIHLIRKEATLLQYMARSRNNPGLVEQSIKKLIPYMKPHPHFNKIGPALAGAYIFLNMKEEAHQVINELKTSSLIQGESINILLAWQKNDKNEIEEAKEIWEDILNTRYSLSIHAPINNFKTITVNNGLSRQKEVRLFSTVLNELWRLPWFLNYYRKIGVSRFFIVDNNSDDGTHEYLLQQKDVCLFHTTDNYAQAKAGMRWINKLVSEYGDNNWCMYVDVDEALIYPTIEKYGLSKLTSYMDENKHEVLFCFMMDMFSKTQDTHLQLTEDINFLSSYPYFNSNYSFFGSRHCPYTLITGGARQQFIKPHFLTKTPLIKAGRGIIFLNSSHHTTAAKVSDVTGVLLHFKMAGDFAGHLKRVIKNNKRGPDCMRRHRQYLKVLQEKGGRFSLFSEDTHFYKDSQQLVDMGLIQFPDSFRNFTSQITQ